MRKLSNNSIYLILSLFAVVLSCGVFAQETDDINTQVQSTNDLTDNTIVDNDIQLLDDVIVTAYRFSSSQLQTPTNSTLITSSQIKESGYSNVTDVIKNYGNLHFSSVTSNSAAGSFSMRGFGENSQTRILVLVDGQKINRADMGAINWLQIPVSDIENVEILRGPHTAIYGSSAEAGVIKITTKEAKTDGMSYNISGSYGSYNTYSGSVDISARTEDVFFTVGVNTFSSDGWRENSESESSTAYFSMGYDINENNVIEFTSSYTESNINYAGALTWEEYLADPTQSDGNGSNSYSKDGIYTLNLKTESSIGEGEIGLGWNFRDIDWELDGNSDNFQWTGTFTPRYKFNISDDANILVGFDGIYESIDYTGYYSGYEQSFADVSRIGFAPYIGGDIKVCEDITLQGALRYDASKFSVAYTEYLVESLSPTKDVVLPNGSIIQIPNDSYGPTIDTANSYDSSMWQSGFAANFAINWQLNDNSSVFFKFDRLYHYPTTDEIAAYQGAYLVVPFNIDLKPETGENYEIGFKFIKGSWNVVASVYLMNLTDEIAYAPETNTSGDTYYINTNLPPTIRYGTDLQIGYSTKYWGVSTMLSLVEAKFDGGQYDGNNIPLAPNFYGNISAYVRPFKWVEFSTRLSYTSSQYVGSDYDNLTETLPAYALLDFQLNFYPTKDVTIFLAINNALDKDYISCAWTSGYYPGWGRVFKAGFNIHF